MSDGPRILPDDYAAIIDEYAIEVGLERVVDRWKKNTQLEKAASRTRRRGSSAMRIRFKSAFDAAQRQHEARPDATTLGTLKDAAQRLDIVEGNIGPIDSRQHDYYLVLKATIEAIDRAVEDFSRFEVQESKHGRTAWYREQSGHVLGDDDPFRWPSRFDARNHPSRKTWAARTGTDPIVALTLAREVINAVSLPPPGNHRRGQSHYEQVDRILRLFAAAPTSLPLNKVGELLICLGFDRETASPDALLRRARALSKSDPSFDYVRAEGRKTKKPLGRPRSS